MKKTIFYGRKVQKNNKKENGFHIFICRKYKNVEIFFTKIGNKKKSPQKNMEKIFLIVTK